MPKETNQQFSFQLDEFYLDLQEDGNKISILNREKIEERPFPGLRPFKTAEFQLFKGRDGQAEELIKRLKKNHFLAVIGSSGTGKSSLVRAGLIPQLFGGYLHEAGNKWNIAICRPGKDPVENLAIALSAIKGHSKEKSNIYENYETIGPQLNQSIYGILEVDELLNAEKPATEKSNLLIIIDQFEELFRFDRKDLGKKNIENHFVNLLLKASLNPNSSVYVIITMRSEFLGDCVRYRGLPEAINEGQYLVPQLTRNQLKEVITGPINLAGKKIDSGLVELLVNEIEESKLKENLDQLPILQHALMRTYQEANKYGADAEINYSHYKEIGEMEKALANHAESKFNQLKEATANEADLSKKQKIAKVIFQSLTDASNEQKGGRRPTELKNIYSIAKAVGANEIEVNEVINHFRDLDTSFIMPPINPNLPNTGLYADLIIDISHESLMRNWERLNKWISEEVKFAKLYKTLNERRELNEADPTEFIRGVLLKELLDWETRYSNNVTWASRYHTAIKGENTAKQNEDVYNKNIQFLNISKARSIADREAEEKKLTIEIENAQKEKWNKRIIKVFALATFISIGFGLFAFSEKTRADKQKVIADQKSKDAFDQQKQAEKFEREAKRDRDKAISSAAQVEKQRDLALASEQEATKQKKLAEASARVAKQQSLIAENFRMQAERQNSKVEKQLVRNQIQNQKFYLSNYLDDSLKMSIINSLFKDSMFALQTIPPEKYIDTELLHHTNNIVEAREIIPEEPVVGLRLAENVWSHLEAEGSNHGKNKNIQKILFDVFEKNIFYRQKINASVPFAPTNSTSFLTVANNNAQFAFTNAGQIELAKFENGKISETNKIDNRAYADTIASRAGRQIKDNVAAFSFTGTNKIACIYKNAHLLEWDLTGKQLSNVQLDDHNFIAAQFSKDGSKMIAVSDSGSIKIWNVGATTSKKRFYSQLIDSTAANKNINHFSFSANGNKVIKNYYNSGFEVWDLTKNQKSSTAFNAYRSATFTSADFTSDGNFILAITNTNLIFLIDSIGKRVAYLNYASFTNEEGYTNTSIRNCSLSTDWKKLIIKQGNTNFLIESTDSIFPIKQNITLVNAKKLRFRKFVSLQEEEVNSVFLNDQSVVSVGKTGSIFLWNTDANYNNLDRAFASVREITKIDDKERIDSLDNQVTHLIEKINTVEVNRTAPIYQSIIQKLTEVLNLRKKEWEKDTTDGDVKNGISNNYNDLAYYSLYTKDFRSAIKFAQEGLSFDSSFDIIYTNLALGYLLSNQKELADNIYLSFKDKKMNTGTYDSFKEGFLKDFDDLENAKIISPNDPRVKHIRLLLEK